MLANRWLNSIITPLSVPLAVVVNTGRVVIYSKTSDTCKVLVVRDLCPVVIYSKPSESKVDVSL